MNLKSKRILITGGHGFLGTNLVEDLNKSGYYNLITPTSKECNLTELQDIALLFEQARPNVVIHLAGKVGGIQDNLDAPGEFFFDNLIMGSQLLDQARKWSVDKFIIVGSACMYPSNIASPFKEEDLWLGYPNNDTAPYGMAKKVLLVQSQAYRKQYNFNSVCLILTNMYGEHDKSSHVIPMLVTKFLDAVKYNKKEVVIWGTGHETRDFLYVKNATSAIIAALENYNSSEPINIGSGDETSIKSIVELITKLTGYTGNILYDTSKPSGVLRRCLDITRAHRELRWLNMITLEEGINNTINYLRGRIA